MVETQRGLCFVQDLRQEDYVVDYVQKQLHPVRDVLCFRHMSTRHLVQYMGLVADAHQQVVFRNTWIELGNVGVPNVNAGQWLYSIVLFCPGVATSDNVLCECVHAGG